MMGRERDPDLQRALQMVRRATAALTTQDVESAQALLREAEHSLEDLMAPAQTVGIGTPDTTQAVYGEAVDETGAALQRTEPGTVTGDGAPLCEGLMGLASRRGFETHLVELAETVAEIECCWLLVADIDWAPARRLVPLR